MTMKKNSDIQVLRGWAVLGVVLHHILYGALFPWGGAPASVLHWFGGGAGVDLFFVISGYVIARGLVPQLAGARTPWRKVLSFWGRRIKRLWPAAWFWLLISLVGAAWFNASGVWGSFHGALMSALAAIFQVADFRFLYCYGHYECGAAFVYWTLSLEEQFYLLLPLLLLAIREYRIALIVILSLAQLKWQFLYSHTVFRSLGLFFGVAWALVEIQQLAPWRWLQRLPIALRLGGIFILMPPLWTLSALGEGWGPTLRYDLLAFVSLCVVALVSFDSDLLYRLPGGKVSAWIGDRSYSLYLAHMPAIWVTRELMYRFFPELTSGYGSDFAYIVLATLLMLLFTQLSWFYLEQRFLSRKPRQENEAITTQARA